MKNIIVITGGAGFIGTNLIEYFLKKTKKFKFISLDNYSTGTKKNHIISKRVNYLTGNTTNIHRHLLKYKKRIHTIFHFGEFARIFQSFQNIEECFESNSYGTSEVFKFARENKIKLVYSATSATLGNNGKDKNLSPYAFTKNKNLELLENLKLWFNFKFEVIYFYNVYGYKQIEKGPMATVIGIFENLYKNKKPLTVVKPGTQSRRFTHISDTVNMCFYAWKVNKCKHYSISHKKSYSIINVAKLFKTKIKYLSYRQGERYASALTNISYNNKVIGHYGRINLKDYITSFIKTKKKKI
jgi:UDP-glucose 4-epimerase